MTALICRRCVCRTDHETGPSGDLRGPRAILEWKIPEIVGIARGERKRSQRIAFAAFQHEDSARPSLGRPAGQDSSAEAGPDDNHLVGILAISAWLSFSRHSLPKQHNLSVFLMTCSMSEGANYTARDGPPLRSIGPALGRAYAPKPYQHAAGVVDQTRAARRSTVEDHKTYWPVASAAIVLSRSCEEAATRVAIRL